MASTEMESLLNEIGQLLTDATRHPLAGVLLYTRVATNWVSPAIFIERGDHVEYSWTGDGVTYPLLDLWEEQVAAGQGELNYPPDHPKMPGEPPRVQPSKKVAANWDADGSPAAED